MKHSAIVRSKLHSEYAAHRLRWAAACHLYELDQYSGPDAATTAEVERTAFHLARAAGARIRAAYGRQLQVDFKPSAAGRPHNSNPVSDADRRIESLIRSRLSNTYPDHAVIGEELPATGAAPFTWVIDPIDGRELTRRSQGSWRGLASEPGGAPTHAAGRDTMLYLPVPRAAAATLADRSEPLLIGAGAEIERAIGARNRSC